MEDVMTDETLETGVPEEEVTLDSLADVPIDTGEVAQGAKDAKMTAGWYTTDPEAAVVKVGKSEKNGRAYARFFGRVVGAEEGRIGFAWSWIRFNRVRDGGDTGKPDMLYKAYVDLVGLYEKAFEAKPEKVSDINRFVETTPIQVRVIPGNDDPMVVQFRLIGG